jgi:hypothetical protein
LREIGGSRESREHLVEHAPYDSDGRCCCRIGVVREVATRRGARPEVRPHTGGAPGRVSLGPPFRLPEMAAVGAWRKQGFRGG